MAEEMMSGMLQEAEEMMAAARSYRGELTGRLRGLSEARGQIQGSAAVTRQALRLHFQDMVVSLSEMVSARLTALLQEVDAIERQNIKPLDDCRKVLELGVTTADGLLREGEAAVSCTNQENLRNFTHKALQIQLDSLPEVPALVEVPCLSAQLDDSVLSVVRDLISKHGAVTSRPPVQIEELKERPGGILVRWCKVDDDFVAQDYRLQYRKNLSGPFEDAYVGSECEFIVLHIAPRVEYEFRVCARGDGRQEWSPWSVPQSGQTTLIPHEWCPGLEAYSLSSRRNIALRNDSSQHAVLYSRDATYCPGQTLTFRVETSGASDRRDSIGVCVEKLDGLDSLQRDRAVCIGSSGAVYVNGKEMTNQLPPVSPGSAITFDMELVSLGMTNEGPQLRRRVTIGSGNREVVFDWQLEQSPDSLYFGCSFFHPGWKVLVF